MSHFGHATFSNFETFDALIAGVTAKFSGITPLPHSVAVRVKYAEGIVSRELKVKVAHRLAAPPDRSSELGTNRIAIKDRGAKQFFRTAFPLFSGGRRAQPGGLKWRRVRLKQCLSLGGRGAEKWKVFV